MKTDDLPTARVFAGWFYQFDGESPVGPFLGQLEAGRAARAQIIARAELNGLKVLAKSEDETGP